MSINISIIATSSIHTDKLHEVKRLLNVRYAISNSNIHYWDKTYVYDSIVFNKFKNTNAMVIINDTFSLVSTDISADVLPELIEVIKQNKPIFLAYKKLDGELSLYNVSLIPKVQGYLIKGIKNTSGNFGKFVLSELERESKNVQSKDIPHTESIIKITELIDERLLLMINC